MFLAFADEPVTLTEVADAVVVDIENCTFDMDERMPDPWNLCEILSGLITLSDEVE